METLCGFNVCATERWQRCCCVLEMASRCPAPCRQTQKGRRMLQLNQPDSCTSQTKELKRTNASAVSTAPDIRHTCRAAQAASHAECALTPDAVSAVQPAHPTRSGFRVQQQQQAANRWDNVVSAAAIATSHRAQTTVGFNKAHTQPVSTAHTTHTLSNTHLSRVLVCQEGLPAAVCRVVAPNELNLIRTHLLGVFACVESAYRVKRHVETSIRVCVDPWVWSRCWTTSAVIKAGRA